MNRRDFFKTSVGASLAAFLASKTATPSLAQTVYPEGDTIYHPLFRRAVADDRSICPANMGYVYPYMNNVGIPTIHKGGRVPSCTVPLSVWDNSQGFQQGLNPIILTPGGLVRASTMVHTVANVPHNPDISWETWRDYAAQPDIDLSVQKLQIIGDWAIPLTPITASSVDNPNQPPDSPVDWQEWKRMETVKQLGEMNDELGPGNHLILELSVHEDDLWTFPDRELGQNQSLAMICPDLQNLSTYQVELLTVFPFVDMATGVPLVQVWAHVKHIDHNVLTHCTDTENVEIWKFIEMTSLLSGAPLPALREANIRVMEKTRIWPIASMDWEPIGGGISQEALANVAMILFGAVVVVAIIALILGAPQIIIVAAVAI